eukprot:900685-Pelagomonas_calceolata.AAC.1
MPIKQMLFSFPLGVDKAKVTLAVPLVRLQRPHKMKLASIHVLKLPTCKLPRATLADMRVAANQPLGPLEFRQRLAKDSSCIVKVKLKTIWSKGCLGTSLGPSTSSGSESTPYPSRSTGADIIREKVYRQGPAH